VSICEFTRHNDEKSEKNIKVNCFKSVKVFKGNCYLNSISYDFLFNSKYTYQVPFRAKNVAFFFDSLQLQYSAKSIYEQINNQNINNSECFVVTFVKIYTEMTSQ
jgi:hypothetical protein